MQTVEQTGHSVAIIGAGPAGIFAADYLAGQGVHVFLLNRDIKPGGLAEYGIFPDKHKMKEGLRGQFRKILAAPEIDYYGNVTVGQDGPLKFEAVRAMGFSAVLVTAGAQGTKWLGLPGEQLQGVYHAKDLVYHYNLLPPFSQHDFHIGRKVAIIGVGNVMVDIAHWLIRHVKVEEVIAIARRGAADVKFTTAEMRAIASNLDITALKDELERIKPTMAAVGQDVAAAQDYILRGAASAYPAVSNTRLRFGFLASPRRVLGDAAGRVCGLEVEETTLVARSDGSTSARGLGTTRILDVDTVVYAIGDAVDGRFGLPLQGAEFAKHPEPRFPVDGFSYEAYDPQAQAALEGVFVAGWAREASSGLVGTARKDGRSGAAAVAKYLAQRPPVPCPSSQLEAQLRALEQPPIDKATWQRLEQLEAEQAAARHVEYFKFDSNEAMLAALARQPRALRV